MDQTNRYRINGRYMAAALVAVPATWLLHEGCHWIAGSALGYDMHMTLNAAYPASSRFRTGREEQLVSAAGPLVTLLQAVLVFMLMRQRSRYLLYPLLFTCFYMRVLAGVMSLIHPNDEARVSQWLGIGTFTLPVIVATLLFIFLYKTTRQYGFPAKLVVITTLLVMLLSSALILADRFVHIRLL
ncbi:MAG: hypothetical protein ABW019_04470 [Chitinophagaceae bacterium]